MTENVFTTAIDEVHPSQLYLSARKLRDVLAWFDLDEPSYDPLPVVELDGETMLTDGHTRAFVAHLAGHEELLVARDTDDLPMPMYRRCLDWCREEGVTDVSDLARRVLSEEAFEECWIARCRASPEYPD